MKPSSKIVRLIALMLLIAMSTSTLFSCGALNQGPDAPIIDPDPDPDPAPPAHIHAYGEWVIVKDATATEDGLMERVCECGDTEQKVIEASGSDYAVSYRNIKSAEYPAQNGYNSKEGLLTLPKITSDGYKFVGWYTASVGGDLVCRKVVSQQCGVLYY